jgi:hypothetical protein
MRTCLISLVLMLTCLAAMGGMSTPVFAVGAPSENFTTPESPLTDNATPEVKPKDCVLQRPSEQTQTSQPFFNCAFISQSSQDQYTVTGNENWELLIDINLPGWLYIYEYFPSGSAVSGQWVAYKWQPGQSGIWQVGPFTPAANEPAGQHVYRVWYYAEGMWASSDNPKVLYKEMAWTYVKADPAKVAPVTPAPTTTSTSPTTPATPSKSQSSDDFWFKFLTNPIVLLAGPSIIVVIVLLSRYFISRAVSNKPVPELIPAPVKKPSSKPLPEAAVVQPSTTPEKAPVTARARLVLPDDLDLKITEKGRPIGRADLVRVMDLDQLGLISRKQFKITFDGENFLIEDSGSPNGTSLNGKDIAGQGPVKLNDSDLIELAGVIKLKFQLQ